MMSLSCYSESAEVSRMRQFTLRLPEELHEKLRWLAYKQRRSQHAVLLEIIEKALADVDVPKEVLE